MGLYCLYQCPIEPLVIIRPTTMEPAKSRHTLGKASPPLCTMTSSSSYRQFQFPITTTSFQQPSCILSASTRNKRSGHDPSLEGWLRITKVSFRDLRIQLALCEYYLYVATVKAHQYTTGLEQCHPLQKISRCPWTVFACLKDRIQPNLIRDTVFNSWPCSYN